MIVLTIPRYHCKQAAAQPEAEEEDSEAMRRQLDALLGQ